MEREHYGVALVSDTKEAMKAEEAGKQEGLTVRIIPTPGRLYASCGFSLKYALSDEQALCELFRCLRLSAPVLYHAERQGLAVTYEPVSSPDSHESV